MTLTLMIAATATVAVAAYAVSHKSDVHAVLAGEHPAVDPTLAGEQTLVGLTDPAAETMAGGTARRPQVDWRMATMNALSDAEDCLDWAEAHGFAERELLVLGNCSFAVRWR